MTRTDNFPQPAINVAALDRNVGVYYGWVGKANTAVSVGLEATGWPHITQRRLAMAADITADNAYVFAESWLWYEESIKCAERNGEQTWLCPACGKMRSLFGQLCIFCRGDEDDYRDERDTQSQLRHGG